MADEPTVRDADLKPLLQVLTALKDGDFTHKLPEGQPGTLGEISVTLNALVDRLNDFAYHLTFLTREVGMEGKLGQRMQVPGAERTWEDLQDNVNYLSEKLTKQVWNVAEVTRSYADGDFTHRATVEGRGEILELTSALNRLGERLQNG